MTVTVQLVRKCHMCQTITLICFGSFSFALGGLLVVALTESVKKILASTPIELDQPAAMAWIVFILGLVLVLICALVCVGLVNFDEKYVGFDGAMEKKFSLEAASNAGGDEEA